jgi:hypothetical protein
MIYVDDIATAICHWLTQDIGYRKTYEIDDCSHNGYDWNSVLTIGAQVLRNGAPIKKIPIPIALLTLFAWVNYIAAKFLGYAPMLTPGKIKEITHDNWVSNKNEFSQLSGWQPNFDLKKGLAEIFNINSAKFKVN